MKFKKGSIRSAEEVKEDIKTAKIIANKAIESSWRLGYGEKINEAVRKEMLGIHGIDIGALPWLIHYQGHPRRAFLADSNAIMVKTDDLVEIIEFLDETFPGIERLTSYGRGKIVLKKSEEELKKLREAGLTRLHLGLETGDGQLLKHINKGATAKEMILAGKTR